LVTGEALAAVARYKSQKETTVREDAQGQALLVACNPKTKRRTPNVHTETPTLAPPKTQEEQLH